MIFVDGLPLSTDSSQGRVNLLALMDHPAIISAANSFKTMHEKRFSYDQTSTQSRWVYVFQREYATIDPAFVEFAGTDEATTCVGLVIRNRLNGMTSVAHMDSPKIVDMGLNQMLSRVVDHDLDVDLDVHLIGGYEDVPNGVNGSVTSDVVKKPGGFSLPLCSKIVEALGKRQGKFHVQTFFILGHNTERDSLGNARPIFSGFLVETSTGALMPATFDSSTRCPDEIVRRIRVTACHEDPTWTGKLLETYETQTHRFVIAACSWSRWQLQRALMLRHLSDEEILSECSTSPSSEGQDFADNLRRQWDYLIKHPDWQTTFPGRQPRIFERSGNGGWVRCLSSRQVGLHEK